MYYNILRNTTYPSLLTGYTLTHFNQTYEQYSQIDKKVCQSNPDSSYFVILEYFPDQTRPG